MPSSTAWSSWTDAGRPLRKAPLWNDTRGAADARALVAALGGPEATARRIGSVPTSSFTVAHWAWLRRRHPRWRRPLVTSCYPTTTSASA